MTEAKKTGAKRTKSVQNADLVEMAAVTTAEVAEQAAAAQAPAPVLPSAETEILSSVREQGDALRKAVRETLAVSAQGALEVNDKIIDALHSQSHAALDLWRNAATASDPHLVFQTQAHAARQAYATASAQWKDIAETTTRWMARSFEPLQSALHSRAR